MNKNEKLNGKLTQHLPIALKQPSHYPSAVFNTYGQFTAVSTMHPEVSKKQVHEKHSEEKYQTIIEQATDAILIYSFDGTIHEFNKSCYTLLGYTKEEYAKLKLNDILTGSIIENVDNHAAILAGESKTVYRNLMCKNGDLIEAEVTIKLLADGKAIAFARDLTERKYTAEKFAAMEKEIMDGKIEEQKKITRAVINAQEKERKHIGEELHDNINQLLATTKLYLSLAGKNDEQLRRVLDFPVELIDNTIREIRMLTRKIVTSTQNVNLKELVCSLLACMYKNTLIKTHFDYTGLDDLNDDELKLNIYRIIQEQTNNITKHACAANVNISIHVFEQYVTVEIKDDGAGFDITTKKEGIGIINITNRVQSFNGEIDITSGHGKGCTLKIKIPC